MKYMFSICVMLFMSAAIALGEKDCGFYVYQDEEENDHLITLCIDGINVSGDVTKWSGGIGNGGEKYTAKFTGKVVSGSGIQNHKLEITFLGDQHNLDHDKQNKAIWNLKPGNELKVPVYLPIGRTGFREVVTFFVQDYN